MEKIIELKIDKIIYNGYSIGKNDGITIFTRWGVPGDIVKVEIIEKKRNYYSGRIVQILKESESRIKAQCPYFEKCGGCHLQNISYETQLAIKESFVKEALERYKTNKNIKVYPIIRPDNIFRYRNKAQLPVKNEKIGFYSMNSHKIVRLMNGCLIQEDIISKNIRILNKIAAKGGLSKHIKHIVLRKDTEGVYIIIITDKLLKEFPVVEELKNIIGVYQSVKENKSNKIMGDQFIYYMGEKYLRVKYFNDIFEVYPWSFLQVNDEMAEKLYEKAMEYIEPDKNSVVLDGYSGVGILSMIIAKRVKRVYAVEYEPMSVVSLGMNMQKKGIENIRPYQGDIEEVLTKNRKIKFNRVIIDPPKKGLTEGVIREIIKRRPERIVYISCNPQTLVRDLDRFISVGNYRCKAIQPFDMFPQTFHLENIAVLESKR